MIKYLKLRSSRIIVKCILGIIILSLIFSTMSNYINNDLEKYVAIVNGEKINLKTLQNMYFIERKKQKKILGKNFFKINNNKKIIQETYNYILYQLINNILLEQYVKKIQLNINDDKIKKIIFNAPIFQSNNTFDKKKYFDYLKSINLTNHEYIHIIKKKINVKNFIRAISDTNFILNDEKNNIIKLLSQKRKIKKAILKIQPIIDAQNISDKEANKYYFKHKNYFYIPEKFKISFIQLKPTNFKNTCSTAEINQWYTKNIEKYSTQEKRKYSIIQTQTKDEALSIISQLYAKKNFSKIAKEQSIDPISSKNGGNIGWLSIDSLPDEIKNANLNKKNQISNILPFHNNFLIIKLDEIETSRKRNISEVLNDIKKEIKKKKALVSYYKLQNKISNSIKKNPDRFDLVLKETNMNAQETDWFDKYSIPKIFNIPILKKIIFNKEFLKQKKKLNTHSDFIVLKNNQSFLLSVKDYQKEKIQEFKHVKKNIIQILKRIKAIKKTKIQTEKIIFQLKKGNTNLFKKLNLDFNNSEIISRYDNNPIKSIIFSLPHPNKEKKIYTMYQDKNKNFVIVLLEKIYNEEFSKNEKKIIIEYLEKNSIEATLNALLKNLREKSDIIYNKIEDI